MASVRQYLLKMASASPKANKSHPFTVSVEGNMGSGKTTFINYLQKFSDASVITEPLDQWRNCQNHNLLQYFYNDPKKWAFTFQSYVQLTMLQNHVRKTDSPVKVMERSVYSARYCFVEKLAKDGLLSSPEKSVLDEWFKYILTNNQVSVDLIVYLRSSPEVVYERIAKRNRKEEKTVPFQYIKDLHDIHENWLFHKTTHTLPAPVISIDANLDLSLISEEYLKCETHIFRKNAALA